MTKAMNNDNKYGKCGQCGEPLMAAELYVDYERDKKGVLTGRQRLDIGYLQCPCCLKKYCVDDSFATPWHY